MPTVTTGSGAGASSARSQDRMRVAEIAKAWNVDVLQIPHRSPPTRAMETTTGTPRPAASASAGR
ncbi:hypothetical protein ACWC24_19165 [Streptomyces sp. NPDC001443]